MTWKDQGAEGRYRSLIENASDMISVVEPDLTIILQTGSGTQLLGYPGADLEGTKFSALVDRAGLIKLRGACASAADGVAIAPVELRLRHSSGGWIDAETAVRLEPDAHHLVLTTRDAQERKRAERRLRRKAAQQEVVAALGARALEGEELSELMSDAAIRVAETLDAAFVGVHEYLPDRDAFVLFAGEGPDTFRRTGGKIPADGSQLGETLRSGRELIVGDWTAESKLVEATFFCAQGIASGIAVPFPATPEVFGVLSVQSTEPHQFNYEDAVFLRAITSILAAAIARHQTEEKIRHQALHDSLTTLPNRVLLEDRLSRALATARRHGRSLAVLFLDLDHFKRVNDGLGHTTGDEVLLAVAQRLSGCLRSEDTLARFGGDEFVVLLPEIEDAQGWRVVVERIREALRAPLSLDERQIMVSVSIGVALGGTHEPGKDAQALVRDADLAMYAAKQSGPGRETVFAEEMYHAAVQRLDLLGDLHRAVEEEQFVAHYQPIVSLQHETIVGLEALVRWEHPHHGLLPPSAFLPLAEETGLMIAVGHRVLRQACQHLRRWQDADPRWRELYVSVNLSTQEVHDPALVERVAQVLDETGVAAANLVLEITEGVLLETDDEAIDRLKDLGQLGLRLAVDDFGTGYSALSYLQRFPMDILKIDKTFIDQLGEHEGQERLVNGIIELARGVNLQTVAEGIETPQQADALRGMNAGLGQGFHFARPLRPADVDALLAPSSLVVA
ncbi:MAG TPA: EAL domain-containing protein [Solirubrobacteraceae bacterium]|nr:EAL domain-containing protein [Solirubrobacteraceae bacterium]